MINIIVCMKQVIDPEAPLSLFHIDPEAKRASLPKATPPVLSPFDENALEAALKIKDKQEATITVISMGRKLARAVVKTPLAAGADQLILLEDEFFDDFDTYSTAIVLATAIKKLGEYDLILAGLQAADTNAGQVGLGIAEMLGIPGIIDVCQVEFNNGEIIAEKECADGSEVIEVQSPALITTNYEIGTLREPGVEAFMSVGKKPVTVWNAQQLGITAQQTSRINLIKLVQPVLKNKCELIDGANPEEKGTKLASKLIEAKIF